MSFIEPVVVSFLTTVSKTLNSITLWVFVDDCRYLILCTS